MKQTRKHTNLRIYRAGQPKYPNAADNRYYKEKVLDIATAVVSMVGFVSAMVFLITMV